MEKSEAAELFSKIRLAHRVSVSYYKRLFQLLREVVNNETLGLNFYYWEPSEFNKPCQASTNVLDRWEWDLLPGNCTYYFYNTAKDNNVFTPGEWMLIFHVITDTGILEEHRDANLDPLELEISAEEAKSVIRCYFYAPYKKNKLNWYKDIWNSLDFPKITDIPEIEYLDDDNEIYGCAFEMVLEELTEKDASEILVNKIIKYRDALLPK